MAIVKVIEVLSEGKTIEKAVEAALKDASKTVRSIKSIYIQDIQAIVGKTNKIAKYRINAKISFVVDN
ncbi:MAG: dodecin family protein [Desulfobulbales bacterium]|nr:dodecin family protein [Desulfobulbales bacterium]